MKTNENDSVEVETFGRIGKSKRKSGVTNSISNSKRKSGVINNISNLKRRFGVINSFGRI